MATWFEFASDIVECAGLSPVMRAVSHTTYPAKALRPLWSPLESERGVTCRPWRNALPEYIGWLAGQA